MTLNDSLYVFVGQLVQVKKVISKEMTYLLMVRNFFSSNPRILENYLIQPKVATFLVKFGSIVESLINVLHSVVRKALLSNTTIISDTTFIRDSRVPVGTS